MPWPPPVPGAGMPCAGPGGKTASAAQRLTRPAWPALAGWGWSRPTPRGAPHRRAAGSVQRCTTLLS